MGIDVVMLLQPDTMSLGADVGGHGEAQGKETEYGSW